MEYAHRPVLLDECIEALKIDKSGTYVDMTLGRAGHSREILKRLGDGRLVGIDRDAAAIEAAERSLSEYAGRFTAVRGNFKDVKGILQKLGIAGVEGILMDLGVSSPQLDDASRGFSYRTDAPLDMRMDQSGGSTAGDLINTFSYEELKRVLYEYGEERYAPLIAAEIVRRRPLGTTFQLVEAIRSAMPAKALREKQHPAKRTFQAVRIAVNGELEALEAALAAAAEVLKPGGRLTVISFHSLEDRIVKDFFQKEAKGCTCPPDFPVCVCGKVARIKLITKKPILPSPGEERENPRSRSAKLRVGERTAAE